MTRQEKACQRSESVPGTCGTGLAMFRARRSGRASIFTIAGTPTASPRLVQLDRDCRHRASAVGVRFVFLRGLRPTRAETETPRHSLQCVHRQNATMRSRKRSAPIRHRARRTRVHHTDLIARRKGTPARNRRPDPVSHPLSWISTKVETLGPVPVHRASRSDCWMRGRRS